MGDPYAALASPVDDPAPDAPSAGSAPAPAPAPAPADSPPPQADPYAQVAAPADAPAQIHRYQVKAPNGHTYEFDAPADSTPEELDALSRKAAGYGEKYPVTAPEPSAGKQLLDNTVNDVAGIAQGAAALPDMLAEGTGKLMSVFPTMIGYAVDKLGHRNLSDLVTGDSPGQWWHDIAHHLANPGQIGDAIESVAPTPDTTSGHVNRLIGNLVGGAVTVPASAVESTVARLVGDAPKAIVPAAKVAQSAARETAQAGQDLGVDLPAFTVKGPKATAQALVRSKGGFGSADLGQSAETALEQSRGARDEIAAKLAPPRELDASLGDEVSTAATDARTAERSRIGRMYDSGDKIMGDTPVALDQTKQAIGNLIDQEDAALVPSAAAPILKQLQAKIGNGGPMTAAALRSSAQNIKSLMTSNQIDAGTADHVLSTVTDAMNADIASAAKGTNAAQIYADARTQWKAAKDFEKTVLKPILGASFQNTGDQVARNLVTAAKTNGTRLAKMFAALPEDTANGARSSLIMRLGAPTNAAQNAAGDAFSLSDFLTNWNQLKGSRNLIFPKETVQSLDKLAQIAQHGKSLEKVAANAAVAPRVGVSEVLHSTPVVLGGAVSYLSHDPKEIVMGMLATGLSGLKQYRAARLLASTDFAKKLASTPLSAKGAAAYWSRPWVKAMAMKNPVIAGEIMAFQKSILAHANDNVVTSAAASPDQQEQPSPLPPTAYDRSTWEKRPDGTAKGTGFLGVMKRPDGTVSSEISVGLPINGKEMDVPTMVPGLTKDEIHWLLTTPVKRVARELPDSIRQKAIANAQSRIAAGLSPFKQDHE